ncbi:hypothetical protein AC1031_004936 [Aphanomyces cochlioides]|nr:hypothetical protein AC1031_004936 [Aphanomyces cochlioides]
MYNTEESNVARPIWKNCTFTKAPTRRIDDQDSEGYSSEMCALAKEVADLQARLNDISKNTTTLCKRKWCWSDVAASQRQDVEDGYHEQKRLKLAVDEHMDLIASLQEVMKTTQRINLEEWRCNRLPQDEAAWKAGILNMLTRDYERLDTMLVRNGLVDVSTNLCKTVVRRDCRGSVASIDKVTHLRLQVTTFDDIVKIMNALIMTERGRECLVKGTKWDTLQLLERMEQDSMYMKCKAKCAAGAIQWLEGQVAIKRFVEPNRVVFVVRSVLEDARHPVAQGECYPHDEVGWFVVERKACMCSVKSIVSCTPSPPKDTCHVVARCIQNASDSVQKWFRSCVNVYRQQNRSVTELLVHALAQRFRPLVQPLLATTNTEPDVAAADPSSSSTPSPTNTSIIST